MKTLKYNYNKIIQQHYGQGWEDVSEYKTNSSFICDRETRQLLTQDIKEYRLLGYPTRVITRKTLNTLA